MSEFEKYVRQRYLELLEEIAVTGKGLIESNLNLSSTSKRRTRNNTDVLRAFGGSKSIINNIKITPDVKGNINFEVNRPHAAIHEYGGTINQMGLTTAFGRATKAYNRTIKIRKRPYLEPALQDLQDDDELLNDFLDDIVNEYNK